MARKGVIEGEWERTAAAPCSLQVAAIKRLSSVEIEQDWDDFGQIAPIAVTTRQTALAEDPLGISDVDSSDEELEQLLGQNSTPTKLEIVEDLKKRKDILKRVYDDP